MRLRPSLLAGVIGLALLGVLAAVLGSRRARPTDTDPRRSTVLTGPAGARGLADALQRLNVSVERFRDRSGRLAEAIEGRDSTLILELDPSQPLSLREAAAVQRLVGPATHLLAAGDGAGWLFRCFGYQFEPLADPTPASRLGMDPGARDPAVTVALRPTDGVTEVDSTRWGDATVAVCAVPPVVRVDTILATPMGEPVLLRLTLRNRGRVILVADGSLVENRGLRETTAGEVVLGLIVGRYTRVVVDEYHHGFQAGGSLSAVAWQWLWTSPWGWGLWQLSLVAVLALAVAGVRLGPPLRLARGVRRSSSEHVDALAAALAAARGHDVAVRLMVQGLRRRLSRTGTPMRAAVDPWLAHLAATTRTPRTLEAVRSLQALTSGPVSGDGVLRAANAVEDVWRDLSK
jgi:hypothetical protein